MKKSSSAFIYPKLLSDFLLRLFRKRAHKDDFEEKYFFMIVVGVFLLYSMFVVYIIYYSCRASLEERIDIEAGHINNTLTTVFDETAFVMTYIGKQIAQQNQMNIQYISELLINSSKIPSKNQPLYSWSLFDWVDSKGYALVNSQIGITEKPQKKVSDSYVWKCSKYPWTLQLSAPTIGNTSGMWVIPTAIGITDSSNNYLGALNVAFNVAELNAKVEQNLIYKTTSFIVTDENFKIILQSTDNTIDPKSSYYYDILHDSNYLFINDRGYLTKPIHYNDIVYYKYSRMEKYPYIVLIGYKNTVFTRELQSLALPRIIEFIILGFICFWLFYVSRRKFLSIIISSNQSKEEFLNHVNLELHDFVSSITSLSGFLLKHFKDNIEIDRDKGINITKKIYEKAVKISTLTEDALNFSLIDVNKIIIDSIHINRSAALIKNIKIKSFLFSSLPFIFADELRLKQAICSLINLSIDYNPENSKIIIYSVVKKINNNEFLIIKIEDDGFRLDIKDIQRISNNSTYNHEKHNKINLDFTSIEGIIKLHRGKCAIRDRKLKGKIMNIIIPYNASKGLDSSELSFLGENVK